MLFVKDFFYLLQCGKNQDALYAKFLVFPRSVVFGLTNNLNNGDFDASASSITASRGA
jgi:hypothetical protein